MSASLRSVSLALALALVAAACSPASGAAPVEVSAVVRSPDGLEVERFSVPASDVTSFTARLRARDDVVVAGTSGSRHVHVAGFAVSSWSDDPLSGDQWGALRLGADRLSGLPSPSGVVVAVLDTGVDGSHPDLAGRVLPGWDATGASDRADSDPNGHGTHVAGIIAAVAGNSTGVAGYASGVSILPVRVLGPSGVGDDADLAAGIVYAVDAGADVVNMSVGGAEDLQILRDAAAYAHDRGVLLVASAGNDGLFGNAPSFPAAIPEVMAVGASSLMDMLAMFSNTGAYVDVAAPGTSILSTWPGGRYLHASGTSMAAPFVAAAAARVLAETGLRGASLRSRLQSSALDVGPAGRDDGFGAGLVDVFAATGRDPLAPPAPSSWSPLLPELPTFDLPPLPDLPELVLPPLPDPADLLPPLPSSPGSPPSSSPDLPPSAPSPADPRREVSLSLGLAGGAVGVTLVGPAPLVAFREVSFVASSPSGEVSGAVRLDRDGSGSFTPPPDASSVVVSYAGSLTTLPTSATLPLG